MNKSKLDAKDIKERLRQSSTPATKKTAKEYKVPEKKPAFDETLLRPQALVPPKTNTIVAWIVFAFALIIYMMTQARSLSFWDSGEYATCISLLGVPHPPGNPFYILFGRALVSLLGNFIPHGIIAAFISGLASAFAVMFTYLVTVQLTSMFKIKPWQSMLAGIIAALYTAFSYTFWMNAVEAEVYAGLVFFINLIIWLTLKWVQNSQDFDKQNYLLLIVYLFFLGFCVHQTALQIAPAILFIVTYPIFLQATTKKNFWYKFFGYGAALIITYLIFGEIGKAFNIDSFDQLGFALCIIVLMYIDLHKVLDKKIWLLAIALIILGVSSHIYLPIRAADRPFINLADPSTPKRFDDYIQRRQYKSEQVTSMFARRGKFFEHQLGYHFLRYFSWQWFKSDAVNRVTGIPAQVVNVFGGLFVAFLGLFGAVFHFKNNKHSFFYLLAIFFCTSLLMVFVLNLSSSEVRDRDYFFVAAYNMWAIWLGIGAMGLVSLFKDDKVLRVVMAIIMLFFPVFNMAAQYYEHDRSHELIALDYGVNFLNSVEENAIIFTNGDNDTYPIWYAQAVKDPYAKPYMHQDRDIFPTLESQKAIQKAMDYKNQQCKGIRKDVTVANLSLLNTSWYIRQLRDLEGVVINWTDDEINSLDDRYGSFQDLLWKDQVTFDAGDPEGKMKFTINYRENYENSETNGEFYPRKGSDFAVIQIIKDNFGKRPIYFAVTCESRVGFDDYLRNEGMVSRVVPTYDPINEQIDIDRLLTNIDKVYQYRSIFDPKVYKDDNMKRLVMNYGSGFSRAAVYFAKNHQFDKAEQYAQKARAFIDSDIRLTEFYVTYYIEKGELNKLDTFIENNIWGNPNEVDIYRAYVLRYVMENHKELVPRYLGKIMARYPDNPDLGAIALAYGYQYKQMAQVQALFDSLKNVLHYNQQDILNSIQSEMNTESN